MENEVSRQYAKALFELTKSLEDKQTDLANLKVLSACLLTAEVKKVFTHPTITKDAKKEIIENLLKDQVAPIFLSFIKVLIDNDRLFLLSEITESYETLLDELMGKKKINVKSKYPLNDELRDEIIKYLESYYHKEIILNETVDKDASTGLLITSGNEVIDLTASSKLSHLIKNLKG